MTKSKLNALLIGLGLAFLAMIVLGGEESPARTAVGIVVASPWAKMIWKAAYDLGVGGLTSLLFYLLLVYLPERAKRRRVRKALQNGYDEFKRECIFVMLSSIHGLAESKLMDELCDQHAFRKYFSEKAQAQRDDRFSDFANALDETGLQTILRAAERLRDEIAFALSVIDVPNDEAFALLKRLSVSIHRTLDADLDYDSVKSLCRFLWSIFAGFSFVDGYREKDLIAETINSI